MPASLNKVMLIGNLTRDPEMRYIPSGQAVTTFSVAVNRTYQTPQGEKKEEVNFIRIVAWAKRAEICSQYLKKGSPVFVEGRIQTRNWEAQDGTKRSTTEVVADNIQFLNKGTGKQADQEPSSAPDDETVIEDSFDSGNAKAGMKISPSELQPDEQVPF